MKLCTPRRNTSDTQTRCMPSAAGMTEYVYPQLIDCNHGNISCIQH